MDKQQLKDIISAHKEVFLAEKRLIKRSAQETSARFTENREIILITGIRRSGKSSLMKLICNDIRESRGLNTDNILYVNFDDDRLIDFTVRDFELLYGAYLELYSPVGKLYFFFDEIQNVKGWERWANRIYENENIKVFITGSNASMLSSDISTHLTGRNLQINNWPFSFREFLDYHAQTIPANGIFSSELKAKIQVLFRKYASDGGFPEVVKTNEKMLLQQYLKDILYRDIISRHSIKNIKELKELCLYLSSNIATINSYDNLKKMINAGSLMSIKKYLEYLEGAYLFFRLPMFSYSVKKQIYNPGKFFCVDTGLAAETGFKFSPSSGHTLENMVFTELKRRDEDFYYWKSEDGNEVDFVTRKGRNCDTAIQVSYDISNIKTLEREIGGLEKARKELKIKKFYLLTESDEKLIKIKSGTVKVMPVWKWMLGL